MAVVPLRLIFLVPTPDLTSLLTRAKLTDCQLCTYQKKYLLVVES